MIAAFLATLVGGGHGAGLILGVLLGGDVESWWPQMLFGWLGIAASLISLLKLKEKTRRTMMGVGIVSLAVSFYLFGWRPSVADWGLGEVDWKLVQIGRAAAFKFALFVAITGWPFVSLWVIRSIQLALAFRRAGNPDAPLHEPA